MRTSRAHEPPNDLETTILQPNINVMLTMLIFGRLFLSLTTNSQWRSYIRARSGGRHSTRRKTCLGLSPKPLWFGRKLENTVVFLFVHTAARLPMRMAFVV